MNGLDCFIKENEIMYLQMECAINNTFNDSFIMFCEDVDESSSFIDKISSGINSIIEKIQKLFHDIKESLMKHFSNSDIEKKSKQVSENAKKDPNKKVRFISRKSAIDLSKVTLEDVYKAKDFNEVEARMEKYRKQRNKTIATGVLVTLSLSAVGAFVIKRKNDLNKDLEAQKKSAEAKLSQSQRELGNLKLKMKEKNDTIDKMRDDMSDMKKELRAKTKTDIAKVRVARKMRTISKTSEDISIKMKTEQVKLNATTECCKNICNDIAIEGKNLVTDLLDPNSKVIEKTSNTIKGISGISATVKNAPNKMSDDKLKLLQDSLDEIKRKGNSQKKKCLDLGSRIKQLKKDDPKRLQLIQKFEKEKSVYDKLVSDAKSITLSIADIERKS